ncbi:hypothetical protein HXX25_03355 [Hyphobacterium sp. CCMP332]|jgi:hypothetical protein|uniref:hypothetical protein n=1 Tax=unclassified Hyphobacterium TaxID=2638931 RepID=UPI00164FF4B0|nr:hypothetical protein [Hyphobacterium sp. CCMP332]QNL18456.1 hypothetical protein HXX25_03355 [Hyphobacterium sp. CCMP332]
MQRIIFTLATTVCLAGCGGSTDTAAPDTLSWTSPNANELLGVYQDAGDSVAVIDQNGSDYGPMSMFVSGVELTPESEIAALRERANDVTQVSSGSANCTEIEDVPLEQFCMLSVSGFEIVPDGMECMDMECGESYFEITARLRQTAPGEWEVVGETASGLFAG